MKPGDLMYCTFGAAPLLCTLVSREHFEYWNILLRGRVITMHSLYLEAVCK